MNKNHSIQSSFFVDLSAIQAGQTAAQAFGPLSGNAANVFRTTAAFAFSGTQKAYSICDGVILVLPQTGAGNKFNLVIKPTVQPSNRFAIKYFIYRGLDKASLFDSNDGFLLPYASIAGKSELVTKIWNDFISFHQLGNSASTLESKWIGYKTPGFTATDLLDAVFNKTSADDLGDASAPEKLYELPNVKKGQWVGDFLESAGLDIVLDYDVFLENQSGFSLNLGFAQAAAGQLEVIGGPSATQLKLFKENALHFMDPAAFWGLHWQTNSSIETKSGGSTATKSGASIYSDIISKYYTKNNLYIYLYGDRGRSYNFYGNCFTDEDRTVSMRIGIDENAMSAANAAASGWPLIISNSVQNHNLGENKLLIQLATSEFQRCTLYADICSLEPLPKNDFLLTDLLKIEDNSGYSSLVAVKAPAVGGNGSKVNCALWSRLYYKTEPNAVKYSADEYEYRDRMVGGINDVFQVGLPVAFEQAAQTALQVEIAVSSMVQLVNFESVSKELPSFMAGQNCLIRDYINDNSASTPAQVERMLFRCVHIAAASSKEATDKDRSLFSEPVLASSYPFSVEQNNFYLSDRIGTDVVANRTTLEDRDVTGLSCPYLNLYLGILKEEYDTIEDYAATNSLVNARLAFVPLRKVDTALPESYGQLFEYDLNLIAEDSELELGYHRTDNVVKIYSLDNKFFFSYGYVRYLPDTMQYAAMDRLDTRADFLVFE